MTNYDNFAHTFSESRKNMKWEEIQYFLEKYTPFGDVLDVGCGNGRLFGELINVIPNFVDSLNLVGSKDQSISDSSICSQGQIFSSYLGIDSSSKLLEEASKLYGEYFKTLDMRDISSLLENSFDTIFFIASFHHLESEQERLQVLGDTKKLLKNGGKILLTNWALESDFNHKKYSQSKISGSENHFGGSDFQIKIGGFSRYYHSFTLHELEYLAKTVGLQILENRLFETGKNFISILKSPL